MTDIYKTSLLALSSARKKRGKISLTKKFFNILKIVNQALPEFDANQSVLQPYTNTADDEYSNTLLKDYSPTEAGRGRVAKHVSGNGNCLFNSASVALIG